MRLSPFQDLRILINQFISPIVDNRHLHKQKMEEANVWKISKNIRTREITVKQRRETLTVGIILPGPPFRFPRNPLREWGSPSPLTTARRLTAIQRFTDDSALSWRISGRASRLIARRSCKWGGGRPEVTRRHVHGRRAARFVP